MTSRRRGRPAAGDEAPPDDAVLLDAALEAFAERGFDGMSVREVARAAGVSHNLLPQRFGSKERLWYAAVDHGFAELAQRLAEAVQGAPEDDLVRLRTMVVGFVEANAARPALLRIINQEAVAPGPRLDHLFTTYIQPVQEASEVLLDGLRRAGRVRTGSTMLVYFLMTHGAGGPLALPALAERFGEPVDPTDPAAVRAWAEAAVDVLFEGLAVE